MPPSSVAVSMRRPFVIPTSSAQEVASVRIHAAIPRREPFLLVSDVVERGHVGQLHHFAAELFGELSGLLGERLLGGLQLLHGRLLSLLGGLVVGELLGGCLLAGRGVG